MSSATHDESYGDPRWRYRGRGPWGGWGCWGQQASWNSQNGNAAAWGPPWGAGHPYWAPHFIPKPILIVLTILGFILWWPIGIVLLAVMLFRRHAFCGYRHYGWWQGGAGPGATWKGWFGGQPPSSGNHAFDEYRTETLRRLEEEQKEFGEFLERLRFAKDEAEFDQFMNERRNRPSPPPPSEPPANPAS
jgi:Protein of unknown function (DUF2852)